MPHTRLAMEVEITKEYLGFNTHLAYLGTMWEEALKSRTARLNPSSIVADSLSAMAGVANTGDRPQLERVAVRPGELVRVRQARLEPASQRPIDCRRVDEDDLGQRPSLVAYHRRNDDGLTPGGGGLHDSPRPRTSDGNWASLRARAVGQRSAAPRVESRPITTAPIANGIGFDRTPRGSNAVAQYAPPIAQRVRGPADGRRRLLAVVPSRPVGHDGWIPDGPSGTSCSSATIAGSTRSSEMQREWSTVRPFIDPQRFAEVDQLARDPASRSQVVARRLDRLFPERIEAAVAAGDRAARTFARLLQVAAIPERAGLAALTAGKRRAPSAVARRPMGEAVPLPLPEVGSAVRPSRVPVPEPAAAAAEAAVAPGRSPSLR